MFISLDSPSPSVWNGLPKYPVRHPLTGEKLGYIAKTVFVGWAVHVLREDPARPGYALYPCEGLRDSLEEAVALFQERMEAEPPTSR